MQPLSFALGAALYHDTRLVDDPRPIVELLDALFASERKVVQFCVPRAAREERATRYDRDRLVARVAADELASFLVRAGDDGSEDMLLASFELVPHAPPARTDTAGYRYTVTIAAGARVLERRPATAIVDAIKQLARSIAPRAGVVFTAETARYARALATGGGTGFPAAQEQRIRDVYYATYELGGRVRGPEWGTFLGPHHVEKLGGVAALPVGATVEPLPHGGAYVQLSPELAAPDDATIAAAREQLAARLA